MIGQRVWCGVGAGRADEANGMGASERPRLFLPTTRDEMRVRGWDALDVLLVTGDAYVDHPAFGAAVIGRVLEGAGFRVGIVAQPDWRRDDSVSAMGRPRLFAGATAGAMDSMVANYTANRRPRRDDAYSPSGRAGARPDYATIVYTSLLRHAFPGLPIVLGGIEASLRRFAHYDYWKDEVRRSILLDSKADLVVAGMGETAVVEIARRLANGGDLRRIPGTVEWYRESEFPFPPESDEATVIPSFEEVRDSKRRYLEMALELERAVGRAGGRRPVAQRHGDRWVVEWPAPVMSSVELDAVYALPFQRRAHPSYAEGIPALEPVRFSVVSHRGCFGGCSFCALALHQGRRIVSRSEESILSEIRSLARHPDFRGTVSDVGGPSANMYGMGGRDLAVCERCGRVSCLWPAVCSNLDTSHARQVGLLRKALAIPGVRHLFVASGIRYDLLLGRRTARRGRGTTTFARLRKDRKDYLRLLVERLVGGHLSVAPEHVSPRVLRLMRKAPFETYVEFSRLFAELSARADKKQYLMPYFIASFPGSTEQDMSEVASFLEGAGQKIEQIQDFLPGPMTVASALYWSGLDPEGFDPVDVPRTVQERNAQRRILLRRSQAARPRNSRRSRRRR
ncbi:YgiQ family radical SAM protein [Candidatus Sumerlaeota bacterium]|nr:YgiQ family radical SAM protein [Candidatus Sumerlaeota bacterium]